MSRAMRASAVRAVCSPAAAGDRDAVTRSRHARRTSRTRASSARRRRGDAGGARGLVPDRSRAATSARASSAERILAQAPALVHGATSCSASRSTTPRTTCRARCFTSTARSRSTERATATKPVPARRGAGTRRCCASWRTCTATWSTTPRSSRTSRATTSCTTRTWSPSVLAADEARSLQRSAPGRRARPRDRSQLASA